MRRHKQTLNQFRRTLRLKSTGAITGGYCAGVFKLNEIKSAHGAPEMFQADGTPENPSVTALFFETEPLWSLICFLPFSHLACFARRPPSLVMDQRRRRSPDFAEDPIFPGRAPTVVHLRT
ncbi:hypothetical protein MA16_Dca028907 [Dendrobium catenatum]|uniref:Uncharacterized protein n=1 Tax=Dendrobium catenatum TaxID=906689 RepID=A0A2I0VDP0_9ASPA|nr:hypothetical protein MA16_Dca028907 [Dendrobium catenatum]